MPDGNRKGRIGKADGKNAPARSENRQFGQGGRCGFGGFLSRTFLFSRNTAYNLSGDPGLVGLSMMCYRLREANNANNSEIRKHTGQEGVLLFKYKN